jgi:guanine deaminase
VSVPSLADKQGFLSLAIAEAVRGAQAGQGGPFGAVIVKDGVVIARAANAVVANNDPTAHAEVQAIRAACAALRTFRLDGCDIYASCEPCPMCLGAILWARMRAVYYTATRQDADAAGFDDAVFYQALGQVLGQADNDARGSTTVRERVLCEGAQAPFAAYAEISARVRY